MPFLVIANPAAGSGAATPLETALAGLRERGPVAVVDPSGPTGPSELDAALRRTDHRLVVAGGDGTLHTVLQRALELGRVPGLSLALLPLGTGNDLARTAGIPIEPDAAAALATEGAPVALDLLVDGMGRVAVNVAHSGLGAEAALRSDAWKPRLGRVGYRMAALSTGWSAKAVHVTVEVDDRVVMDGPVHMVAVGNGRTIGGGTPVCPDALLDDGMVDVVVVGDRGRLDLARLAMALRHGTHLGHPGVVVARGRNVRLQGGAMRAAVDGEVGEPETHRRWTVLSRAWHLVGAELPA